MAKSDEHEGTKPVTLRPNAVGMPAVLFQSITTMAPASAVAFSLGAAIPFAGAALPLAVCLALLVCSLIALNIGSLARHLPSAGGYLTYVSRGLGPVAGWLTGWLFSITLITPIQFLVLGTVADSLAQQSILLATLAMGLFYVFCSYAGVIGWGITNLSTYASDSNPWGTMAHRLWGVFGVIVLLALLNSALVNANAVMIAASRVLYAMGRTKTLPSVLGHISPRFRTPDVAILTTTIIGITLTISLGLIYTPMTAFALLGTMITILYLLVYFLTCLAVPFFYWREHRREFRIVRHLLLPGISMLVLIFPLYAQFVPAPSPPLNLAGLLCVVWVVLGVVIVAILRWRAPHALTLVNKVYLEESEAAPLADTQTSQASDEMVSPPPEKETIGIGQ